MEEEKTEKLPIVKDEPRKLGFFGKLRAAFSGEKLYTQEELDAKCTQARSEGYDQGNTAKAEYEAKLAELEERQAQLDQRENDIKEKEDYLDKRQAALNEYANDIIGQENQLNEKKQEVNEKEQSNKNREKELDKQNEEIDMIIKKEKSNYPGRVTEESLKREIAMCNSLDAFKEVITKMQVQLDEDKALDTKVGKKIPRTLEEKQKRYQEVTKLKATLLGMIQAYADTLNEDELHYFLIGDETYKDFVGKLSNEILVREASSRNGDNHEFERNQLYLDNCNIKFGKATKEIVNAVGAGYRNMATRAFGLELEMGDDDYALGQAVLGNVNRYRTRSRNVKKGEYNSRVSKKHSDPTDVEKRFENIQENIEEIDNKVDEIDGRE